jgi:hypothetical protein
MSHGIRVWGPDGVLRLDETSFTMRVVLSALVTFPDETKGMQSFSVPGCTASNSIAVVIPNGPYNQSVNKQFETEMVSGEARVYNYIRTHAASLSTSGTMRLLVIRFAT